MQKEKQINREIILLKYFYDLLSNGITDGITKENYNKLLNTIIKTLNLGSFSLLKKQSISDYDFYNIIANANKLNCSEEPYINEGIELKEVDGKIIAMPTYFLTKKIDLYRELDPLENILINSTAKKQAENIKMSSFDVMDASSEAIDIATKVSSYFVNDLIERYISERVQSNNWPSQCKDIDEYIFRRDIAKLIDEKGTSRIFKLAYLQGIKIACEILKKDNKSLLYDRELYFSNNDENLLAFANFRKIIAPKKFDFLKQYKYNRHEVNNEMKSISIINSSVYKSKNVFIHSYVHNMPDDDIEKLVLDEDVKIMERRISSTHQK